MVKSKAKLNIEDLRIIAEEKGFELLTEVYSPKEDLILKCKNGHIFERRQDRLKVCKGCPKCPKPQSSRKFDFSKVKKEIEEKGFTLLESEYKGANHKMKMMCKEGHVVYKTRDSTVRLGTDCAVCKGLIKKSMDEVRDIFSSKGFTLISEKYESGHKHLEYICPRGHFCKGRLFDFIRNKHCCRKCYALENRGEKHYNFKSDLERETREKRRTNAVYNEWRKNVYKRDSYTCKKCGKKSKGLEAHHIENFSSCAEKRYDIDNGITFCRTCHREFHQIYGRFNNNRKQLNEFLGGQ